MTLFNRFGITSLTSLHATVRHLGTLVGFTLLAVFLAYQWRPTLKLQVGGDTDGYLSGFYSAEQDGDHQFRWTGESATLTFPNVGVSTPLLLNISANALRVGDRVYTATVTVNGQVVGDITKANWRNWRFVITDPTILNPDKLVVGIHATPFVPSEVLESSEDDRSLGVKIESVEMTPQWPDHLTAEPLPNLLTAVSPWLLVLAIALSAGSYTLLRLGGTSGSWAVRSSLVGIFLLALGIAFFRIAPTIQIVLFFAGIGGVMGLGWANQVVVASQGNLVQNIRLIVQRILAAEDVLLLVTGIVLALLLRFFLLRFETVDYENYVSVWYTVIKANGFSAFRDNFANYTPLYLYLLYIMSVVLPDLPTIIAVKLISVGFDCLCAFLVMKIVRLKWSAQVSQFAFLAILFAPTVILNSSLWGQADSIYAAGLLAFVYCAMTRRSLGALVALGLATALKQQALFIAPLVLILLLTRTVRWRHLLVIPIIYLLSILPAWVAGRPLPDLLTIYLSQMDAYKTLSSNAPNMYTWFPDQYFNLFLPAAIIWALACVFLFVMVIYKSRRVPTPSLIIEIGTLSMLLVPYTLPKMHERYFYPADVLSIVFAFYCPQYAYLAIAMNLISFFSYTPYLFHQEIIPLPILAIVLLGVIVLLLKHLVTTLYDLKDIAN